MSVSLKGRSLLTLKDFTREEIEYLLDLAAELKAEKKAGKMVRRLEGKNIVLLFEKTSTRTRSSFEVGAMDMGAGVTFLDSASSQIGKKESLEDSARILGSFYDGIEYRGFSQQIVEDLARFSGVSVFNGLTDTDHPTQALADTLTMRECLDKPLEQCRLAFVGDTRNNVAYCLMYVCAKLGIDFVGWGPKELSPDPEVLSYCLEEGKKSGATFTLSEDRSVLQGADVIYTDIWASMGEEDKIPERVALLSPYKITQEVIASTGNPGTIFMHCLPAFHDFNTKLAAQQRDLGYDIREVEDEVFRAPYSKVFIEAENRMHTIKAVLVAMLA